MPRTKQHLQTQSLKLDSAQIAYLEGRMAQLAARNPTWGIKPNDFKRLFEYLAVQKVTYLYDDELFEGLKFVDTRRTGKKEELLDAYLILDQGNEIHVNLFQFKFTEDYDKGVSTKELYAFVERMNKVFLRSDLQEPSALESFTEVKLALDDAQKANKRAKTRIHCFYIVNGMNASHTDSDKIQEIRNQYSYDRQTHGFTFETYGGVDLYNLCAVGRIPIQEEILELTHEWKDGSVLHHNIGPNPNGQPEKVVVGLVNVNQLIRLVDRYSNNELFEKNVRLFLGTGKDVNRRIIETVTGNQSLWFGFMNNGVSITAEKVEVGLPVKANKQKVHLEGMQIINGCQTVNSLYHAKYDPELKDKFQGNSNVMVRIYQVSPTNKPFLDALIIATNSQNAIRPEDLLSNDPIQVTLQYLFHDYGVAYERKEGEAAVATSPVLTFTKEQAGMAYLGVIDGKSSKLRNSLSRREFFRQGNEYYEAFNLRDPDDTEQAGPLPEDFRPGKAANRKALKILVARLFEECARNAIKGITDKKAKGSLQKGAYYLARVMFLFDSGQIEKKIEQLADDTRKPQVTRQLKNEVEIVGNVVAAKAIQLFTNTLQVYLAEHGGNEDAALKNTSFADLLDTAAKNSLTRGNKRRTTHM